jgi:cation diffusion facilitator CzcD-associated flavoprotein CzcO
MFTLGFPFRPWDKAEAIAGGGEILRYLRETAAAYGVDQQISYLTKVIGADWSAADARWTVTLEHADATRSTRTCGFLYLCSGYYRYDQGYTPTWPGQQEFAGPIVHPQDWPDDLDLAGRRVAVIGSGATAVTMVPALAEAGAQVTMVQRSPSYILSLPGQDPVADLVRKILPERRAYLVARWWNARIGTAIYNLCRKYPARARAVLMQGAIKRLPADYDVDTHFRPAYEPWDQRMCLVPDGDFFAAIKSGKADVVTDTIEAFDAAGLRLGSGQHLDADVIITATGLNLLPLGGIDLMVAGEPVSLPQRVAYKGMMLDSVPNLAFALGYTNASWTLKVDLVSSWVARLAHYMKQSGYAVVTPRLPSADLATTPFIEMSSGYFERSRHTLPLQGDRAPWRLRQHYFKDAALYRGPVAARELEFRRADELARTAT